MSWNDWKALAVYGSADAAAEVGVVLNLRHISYSFESPMMKKNEELDIHVNPYRCVLYPFYLTDFFQQKNFR